MKKEDLRSALLEIGTEEIPARFMEPALQLLRSLAEKKLAQADLQTAQVQVLGSPRRLVLIFDGLPQRAKDRMETVIGPPPKAAKDEQGQWTAAALGFAKTQQIKPDQLILQQTAKGERYIALHSIKGIRTEAIMKEMFPAIIRELTFPKSMVWEASQFRFARPIRWILALYNSQVVRFKLAGVQSDRSTKGLLSQGVRGISIPSVQKYKTILKNRCVMVDQTERQKTIRAQIDALAKRVGGQVVVSAEHLTEVVHLTEYPVGLSAQFEPSYLQLPREVLVGALVKHQKFFPIENEKGQLTHHFIGVRNGPSDHQEQVKEGYERVLRARLADAQFFFEQDRKTKLADLVARLSGVMFHEKLGTMLDKTNRVRSLCRKLGEIIGVESSSLSVAERIALLSKTDLLTHMVGEFPELQGVAGRFYALEQEGREVAQGIEEHYWPLSSDSRLPATPAAALVALADKLDTLAADFSIGIIPTGSTDPHGLRRAAIGVVRILLDQKWSIDLERAISLACELLPSANGSAGTSKKELSEFLLQRLAAWLGPQGYRADEMKAVLAVQGSQVLQAVEVLEGLKSIRGKEEFLSLAAAIKRSRNLLRQAHDKGLFPADGLLDGSQLVEPSEIKLFQSLKGVKSPFEEAVRNRNYKLAFLSLAPLKGPIDEFFEGVMVMVEDVPQRSRRLKLLAEVKSLFDSLADFSKLQVGPH